MRTLVALLIASFVLNVVLWQRRGAASSVDGSAGSGGVASARWSESHDRTATPATPDCARRTAKLQKQLVEVEVRIE